MEIPSAVRSTLNVKGDEDKSHKLQNLVAEQLVGCGFNEILNNSLQRAAYYDGMESYPASHLVKLMNPLSFRPERDAPDVAVRGIGMYCAQRQPQERGFEVLRVRKLLLFSAKRIMSRYRSRREQQS